MNSSNSNRRQGSRLAALIAGAGLAIMGGAALAHRGSTEQQSHTKMAMEKYEDAEEHPFGKASDPASAVKTIEVDMTDALHFVPARIEVKRGEPIRFVVRNQGRLMHEMVIGTEDSLSQHAAVMKKFPGMEHAEPYMAHIAPGETGDMGWTFTQPGEYVYGCLVPGHYDGGMIGRIVVR